MAPIQRLLTLLHSGSSTFINACPVAALREEAEKTIQKADKVEPPEDLKDFVSHTVKAYEDVQHRADEQLQFFVSSVKSITNAQKEIEILYKKLKS